MDLYLLVAVLIAGPVVGSLLGVSVTPSKKLTFQMLSFSGGVMIAISMLTLIPESVKLSSIYYTILGILLGTIVMMAFGRLISNGHSNRCKGETSLLRTSIFLIAGIFLHNLPEGLAVAIGTLSGTKVSLAIAIAIAVHDIPESICTSVPYYYCVKNRMKAFLVSISVTIPTLIGLFLGHYFYSVIPTYLVGVITAFTAGCMIYISADELIPSSCSKNSNHSTILAFMLGVIFVIMIEAFI